MLRHLTLALLIFAAIASPAAAQRDWDRGPGHDRGRDDRGWDRGRDDRGRGDDRRGGDFELIATETADARSDRIVFRVGREEGRFTAIKFRAIDEALLIGGVEIEFANRERQTLRVVARLDRGQESPPIDLAGERRRIETVTIFKRPSWKPGRVTVDLGAKQERGGPGGPPGGPRGWVVLATRVADFLQKDRDVVPMGERYGRFKAIRLTAKQGEMRIYGVRIVYPNNEIEDLPVSAQLKQGQTTPVFDLKGRGRFIERIEIKFRSKLTLKGQGVLEILGLY